MSLTALMLTLATAVTTAIALDLSPGEPAQIGGATLTYIADQDRQLTLDEALEVLAAGGGVDVDGADLNFGHNNSHYWLALEVTNTGVKIGEWYVSTRIPYRPVLRMYMVAEGDPPVTLLDSAADTPFDTRPIASRLLQSDSFGVRPGETSLIMIEHQAGGPDFLEFTIETADSLRSILIDDATVSAIFYAFALASLVFFVLFNIAMRARVGLLYAALFALALLLIAQSEGFAFQFLWPGWPEWNMIAAVPELFVMAGFGFYVAAELRREQPGGERLVRALYGLAILSMALNALVPLDITEPLLLVGYALNFLMLGSHVIVMLPAVHRRRDPGWPALIGAAILVIAVLAIAGSVALDIALPAFLLSNFQRVLYLFISITTMTTFAGYMLQLRREYEAALEREVEAAQRDAALNRELFETEKNYARARDLAQQRQRQLATASHDIRQPLASLRLSMRALTTEGSEETRARLAEAFDYLEGLTGAYIADAKSDTLPDEDDETDGDDGVGADTATRDDAGTAVDPYALTLITDTVDQMFREEANAKGLEFHCKGLDAAIAVPPLPMMRLVNNLVSNAVKYTEEGSVSVSATRDGDRVVVEIADSGPGMTPEQVAAYRREGAQGPQSQGAGLGLAIVDEIVSSHGLTLDVDSTPGAGTTFRVGIPAT